MGYKKPDKTKGFQKGKSGNPLGGQKHNPAIKKLKTISNEQIAEIGTLLLEGSIEDLKNVLHDEKASTIKKWLASVSIRGVAKADHKSLNVILDRIAGKVKERVEFSGDPDNPMVVKIAAMTSEERQAFIRQAAKDLEDCGE